MYVYQALLDKILDDGFVTEEEAALIAGAEEVIRIDPAVRMRIKKEIFSAAYVDVIEDREITEEELERVNSLLDGLAIPRDEVQRELDIIQEIIATQTLCLPFDPVPRAQVAAPIQKSEEVYYQCAAQVLSKRKAKTSPTGYEYTVRRDGELILTNKRVLVVGNGTTSIRFSDIVDVDVDIDEGLIEISKAGSGRPVILRTDAPIYTGRAIDILANEKQVRGTDT